MIPTKLRIRTMVLADHGQALRLWMRTPGIGVTDRDNRAGLAYYLKRNKGLSFIALEGRKLVGVVLGGNEGRRGYLHHLAVAKSHQRRGIGTLLVKNCLKALHRQGITRCNAFVFSGNSRALRYWRRRGWVARRDLLFIQRPT